MKKHLYNLNDDPHELKDLLGNGAESKRHVAKVAELDACFHNWMERTR